jgi:hypothetical protein
MLASERFDKAQFVSENECFAVLGEALPPILAKRMDGHRKKTKFHGPDPV